MSKKEIMHNREFRDLAIDNNMGYIINVSNIENKIE
jgi:hypothetical protein